LEFSMTGIWAVLLVTSATGWPFLKSTRMTRYPSAGLRFLVNNPQ
jgi:hypothetical protein